jgi:ubiquinone/menaquinone biosynthesis C-methylase UbiE
MNMALGLAEISHLEVAEEPIIVPPREAVARRRASRAAEASADKISRQALNTLDRFSLIALAPKAGEHVLDVGCDNGRRFGRFVQAKSIVVGIDAGLASLRGARRKFPECLLLQCALQDPLPFTNRHFDAVLCALAGEHLDRIPAVLREFHRILKPGGRIVLALHYPGLRAARLKHVQDSLYEAEFEFHTGSFRHSVHDYTSALIAVGFVDIRQHQVARPGRQQSLFPEEGAAEKQNEYPAQVVLQARRAV